MRLRGRSRRSGKPKHTMASPRPSQEECTLSLIMHVETPRTDRPTFPPSPSLVQDLGGRYRARSIAFPSRMTLVHTSPESRTRPGFSAPTASPVLAPSQWRMAQIGAALSSLASSSPPPRTLSPKQGSASYAQCKMAGRGSDRRPHQLRMMMNTTSHATAAERPGLRGQTKCLL